MNGRALFVHGFGVVWGGIRGGGLWFFVFGGGGLGLGDGQVFATGAMPYQRLDR